MTATAEALPLGGKPATATPSWDAVALELARRRPEAYSFVAHGLRPAPHHLRWLERLREAVTTPGGRLVLVAPPGHGKSAYVSHVLPLWYLGRHPERAVLAVTSSDAMASQFHGTVELALRLSEAHRAVFPAPAGRPDPNRGWSSDGLYLRGVPPETKDPSYRVAGFGSKVIGSRCHLLVLDDPVDQPVATSPVEMARVRQYLDLSLTTRLHPQGSAVCISTRWAEDDVVAHLERQGWPVLVSPALSPDYPWPETGVDAEGNVALWPARYPLSWLEAERRRLGGAQFSTVYQGDPVAVGAGLFRPEWLKPLPGSYLSEVAPQCSRVTFVDTAWSSKQTADYSAAVTLAYLPGEQPRRLFVVGLFRKRVDEAGLPEALLEHLLAVQPAVVGVEEAAYRQEATAGLVLRLRALLSGRLATHVQAVRVTTDKVARARLPAGWAEAGLLHGDTSLPLWPTFEREVLGFPLGSHDDLVDSLSGACALALGPHANTVDARPVKVRWRPR
jgi:predicted phage terminase large subunit-like protein